MRFPPSCAYKPEAAAARSLPIALLFTLWGWTAGGSVVVSDDILEVTSEELNELVVLVARE